MVQGLFVFSTMILIFLFKNTAYGILTNDFHKHPVNTYPIFFANNPRPKHAATGACPHVAAVVAAAAAAAAVAAAAAAAAVVVIVVRSSSSSSAANTAIHCYPPPTTRQKPQAMWPLSVSISRNT